MSARCVECQLMWRISIKKRIPKEGYLCPWCIGRRKRNKFKEQLEK